MRKYIYLVLFIVIASLGWIIGKAWIDARTMAPELATRADGLIENGKGWRMLGNERKKWLLAVEDPVFETHVGIDLTTPGAGTTTLTQSLSKQLAFDEFEPGIAKLRQTVFALSLERQLTKEQIAALWLDTAQMGPGSDGWIEGFEAASLEIFGEEPSALTNDQYLTLVAVLIAPSTLALDVDDPQTTERISRIKKLIAGDCVPIDNGDVWLEGCA